MNHGAKIFGNETRAATLRRNDWKNVVKTIQDKMAGSLPARRLVAGAWLKLALVLGFALLAGLAGAQPANDMFTNAATISGLAGTLSSANNGATLEPGEPTFINADDFASVDQSVWYQWTAPSNGVAAFDTFGSSFDTVLAVYTNSVPTNTPAVTNLNLVAANDDYITLIVVASRVTFTAVQGTTYYISVNGNQYPAPGYSDAGNFVLDWNETVPIIPSGTFYFSSDTYTVSDHESTSPQDPATASTPTWLGARVTVARTNGFNGRVDVPYGVITQGHTNVIPGYTNVFSIFTNSMFVMVTNIIPSYTNSVAYITNSGTLVFDDYQMSADIAVPVKPLSSVLSTNITFTVSGGVTNYVTNTASYATPTTIATIAMGTPTLDPLESSDLIPPNAAGGTNGTTATVSVLSATLPVSPAAATPVFFNIERATFRANRGIGSATIYIYPSAAPPANHSYTVQVALDHSVSLQSLGAQNHTFDLQAGSDYANPGSDFTDITGTTLTWSAGDASPHPVSIPINNISTAAFNGDVEIELYNPEDNYPGGPTLLAVGQVNKAILTILFNVQPAGAVDQNWNPDGANSSVPPYLKYPGTQGGVSDGANGNGGTVYAVAEQPDGKVVVAGSFISYDSNPYNRIVRVLNNGYQDPTFLAAPNSGANEAIYAMALQPDGKIIIGGNFTAFNGVNRNHIARLNTDGTVDTTFNPGSGANGKVWAVGLQSNGQIFIAGEFTSYNSTNCNYLARLNTDGSLDTVFNPGSSLNGPVYALAVPPYAPINLTNVTAGGAAEVDTPIKLGSATSGTLTVAWNFQTVPDDMRVFYGDTNTAGGTGVLIFDTGLTNNVFNPVTGQYIWVTNTIPFGPTNGITTNLITIVMDQGNGTPGTAWSYSASVVTAGSTQVYAGGNFNQVNGASYGGVARFNGDGTIDYTFAPGIGTYNPNTGNTDPVYALALQPDGRLLAGGSFSTVQLLGVNGIARFNMDGSLDTSFSTLGATNGTYNPLTGIADTVNVITLDTNQNILIGGNFMNVNQTRRVGLARLFPDGSLDTSFMDTAYNQFAGIINHYHNPTAVNTNDYPQGNNRNAIKSIALEAGGNVIVGGNFLQVGGGSYGHSGSIDTIVAPTTNGVYSDGIIDNGRMDVHPRSNVARLIGGSTTGPGNLEFSYNNYTVDKDARTLYVSLVRTNGNLGTIAATLLSPPGASGQQGIATQGTNFDFTIGNLMPEWATMWSSSWMKSSGFSGQNYSEGPGDQADETFAIYNNTNITGNLNANLVMTAPNPNLFFLGGEEIPLGAALGATQNSPLTIIDDNFPAGTLGFNSPTYTVNESSNIVTITVVRTNGTGGSVNISYATFNGTATSPANYTAVSGTLTFNQGVTSQSFTVPIIPSTGTGPDKTFNLVLYHITGGGSYGLTNAVVTIVNNVFGAGHIAFAFATNTVSETAGVASVVLNRLGASSGTLQVTAITGGGSAVNGVNYVGSTTNILWNSGDALPKAINIPVIHDGIYTSNLTVNISLTNGLAGGKASPNVLGLSSLTNSTLVITNVDFPGTVQFSSGVYSVKKSAGFALIPVIRTGGSAGTITVTNYTANGTALNGVNYTGQTNVLVFTNGQVSQSFKVPITPGATNGLVTLNLGLTNAVVLNTPLPWNALGSPSGAVLNIIDTSSVNEPPGSPDTTYSPLAAFNQSVFALALQPNNQLLVGGDFTMANGVPRQRVARLNSDGTLDASFSLPSSAYGANASVRALAIQSDGRILVGGYFTNFNSVVMNYIARLNYNGSLDSRFNPGSGADSPVFALAQTFVNGASKILVGGGFASLNGVVFNYIGRLNDDGSPDTTFNAGGLGANGTVYALAVQSDGKVVIGGDFTTYNNTPVNHVARLNVDGSLDLGFTNAISNLSAGANDSVRAITIQLDGKILIGGLFTNVDGTTMNHIARLNTDGSLDAGFTPGVGADDAVLSIVLQTDERIVLGGQFTHCNGVSRNRITRLNPNGTVDPTINFGTGANDFVAAVVVQEATIAGYPTNVPDEKLIIGGGFTQYFGQPHSHIARIFGGSVSGVGAFEFSSPTYSADENNLNAFVTVIRTGGTSGTNVDGTGDIFVPFATANGTAIAGINYSNATTNLDFPAGEVMQTVTIPVKDDGIITPNLSVNLSVNPVLPATYGDQPTAVLTILNDDSSVSFSSSSYQVAKNVQSGVKQIDILRLGGTNGTATVVFNTTTNGTALPVTDYTPQTNVLVTFNPGVSDVQVPIPINNNGLPEGNQTVALQLTNVTGSTLYSPSNATLTIIDTAHLPGALFFSTTNYNAGSSDGNAYLTVYRTNGFSGIVSVNYTLVPGTAQLGADYTSTGGLITFGDGVTSRTITIPLVPQAQVKPPVSLSVFLSSPVGGATLASPTNATVTISSAIAGVSFVTATNTMAENSGSVVVNVQRLYNTNSTITVNYGTVNGTAVAGVNYSATSGLLQFTNGETLKSITIPLLYNTNVTGDLKFTVQLSNPTGGAQLLAPSSTVVIEQDADAGLSFSASTITVLKNSGVATVTVVCSNPRVEPPGTNGISVSYYTVDGSAKAGTDYQAASGTLVFSGGVASNTFPVTIYNNTLVSGNKVFSVMLTNATAPGQITAPATASVVIAESNAGLSFSQSGYTVLKNGIAANITVNRTGFTNSLVSVNYLATNGTAVNGINFVSTNGVLVFSNGVVSQTFSVPIIANTVVNPNLTVLLQLLNPVNGYLVPPSVASLTILENGGSFVIPAGAQVVTNYTSQLSDGVIGSNDTVQVLFALRDSAGLNVTNLIAYLLATNGVVSPSPASQVYGPLTVYGHSVSEPFTFTAHSTNSFTIAPTFALYDNTKPIGTAVFHFSIGNWTTSFASTNTIVILDNTNASPYPSTINVSGIGTTLIKATVTLNKLTHTYPHDIDALVVSPAGTNTLIMAHVGGGTNGNSVANITLTFDDAATNSLTQNRLTTSTNKPTQFYPVRNFP
jgi:uncharacterized delta-60 repeat protein